MSYSMKSNPKIRELFLNECDNSEDDPASLSSSPQASLLTCTFNQDGGCLAIGTTTGFSVHNLYPQYAVSVRHDSSCTTQTISNNDNDRGGDTNSKSCKPTTVHINASGKGPVRACALNGGIGLVELMFRCNLMLIVGGGPNPHAPPNRVLIWDDHVARAVGELSFRQSVLGMKLRKDAIAIALRDRCYVYDLATLTLRDKIYTDDNPHGLLCLSTSSSSLTAGAADDMVLACPSVSAGHVRVELYGIRKTVLLEAHESSLRALALTSDGSRLATASEKGTILRVFDVASASCIQEFRRGYERATVTCLAFGISHYHRTHYDCEQKGGIASWLACCSDKGTTHVFHIVDHHNSYYDGRRGMDNNKLRPSATSSSNGHETTAVSLTSMIFSTVRKSVFDVGVGDAKKSICQIRGVPHPRSCSFISEAAASTSGGLQLAVAGWDADGNGVLLISEIVLVNTTPNATSSSNYHHHNYSKSKDGGFISSVGGSDGNNIFYGNFEAKRIGYHVLCRPSERMTKLLMDETEDARRRRRMMRGWIPDVPATPPEGCLEHELLIQERQNVAMNQIRFEENYDDDFDEFVSIIHDTLTNTSAASFTTSTTNTTTTTNTQNRKGDQPTKDDSSIPMQQQQPQQSNPLDSYLSSSSPTVSTTNSNGNTNNHEYSVGDSSIRTEPIHDDDEEDDEDYSEPVAVEALSMKNRVQ